MVERVHCMNCDIVFLKAFLACLVARYFHTFYARRRWHLNAAVKMITFKINGLTSLWIILQKPATRSFAYCNHWPGWSQVIAPAVAPPVFMLSAWQSRWPSARYPPKHHSWFLSQTSHVALGKLSRLLIISHLTIHPIGLYRKVVSWSWL